ncbi:hypothetical protein PILCRDRAFT_89306 [Piloderma croceum F 1598]|uniref:F-box domain-containing protein n=1 Tax=Piloderma croceum (strain F 1598) TaxID=765440 RepID=A0A0C3BUJ9_PILCF|nr:hypothetical protein PILCRDRAFT_89306 [Piloderma croceum F 1598]
MHACLSIPEILTIICNQLVSNDELDVKNQDLASLTALARTSHIFSELALNALWYGLPNLAPLLLCMPSDLLDRQPGGGKRLFLRRSIVSTDWSRFDYHAKRVRSLGFLHRSEARQITPDSEVLRAIRLSRPLAQLCPNLRHLNWSYVGYNDVQALEHIYSLIGPEICRLFLEIGKLDLAETSLIRSIPVICPRITHLSICVYYRDHPEKSDHFREMIWETVCCYELVDFWSDLPVSQRALLHLAGMPALRKLALEVSGSDAFISLSLPQCPFPALRDLDLTGKMAPAFLEALPSCMIEAIRINSIPTIDDVDFMARFFQVLHERCSRQSLSRIGVYFGTNFMQPYHPGIDLADMLQPLLSFVNLQDITISIHHLFRLDNNFVEAAAKSWPRLRSLKLGIDGYDHRSMWGGRSNITLIGLASLARHCPDLTSLAIVIDATVVDHVLDIPVSNTKLDVLHLGNSIIENPTSVAACLSRIFPCLTSIYSYCFPPILAEQMYPDRWNEVARLINKSADVRKMERNKMDR